MKKLISIFIVALLWVSLLASCGDSESEGNELSETGTEESKPWYSTSTPDDYSNIYIDMSSDGVEESNSNNENSIGNNSSTPEVSNGGNDYIEYSQLEKISVSGFSKAAKAYSIAFTKTSALQAKNCITNSNIGITAIYDGSVTRFFDAVNGMYFHAISGKYLYPCCEGFLAGDLNEFNSKYSITFTRNGNDIDFAMNDHAGHGIDYSYNAVYSAIDSKVYLYDQELYAVSGATPCRYFEDSVLDVYNKDGCFDVDESRLSKYGVASNEKIIIPFEYDLILTAQGEENVGVYLAIKDGRSYYLSSDGKNLTPDGFDCGSQPFGDRAWVFEDGQGWIIKFN